MVQIYLILEVFINKTRTSGENFECALDKLNAIEHGNDKFFVDVNVTDFRQVCNTGVFANAHVDADDNYDAAIELILNSCNIDYTKKTHKEVLTPSSIFSRIVMPENSPCTKLVSLDTQKIEELFKKSEQYISESEADSGYDYSFEGVREFLKTGKNIDATEIVLQENEKRLALHIIDGRHRYCVMRDLGMDKIKFAMNDESYSLAVKYGLISK